MKLLGHTSPEMTMRYLEVALTDLQREFDLARSQPRHLAPQPKTHRSPPGPASTASSTLCALLNTSSRCSGAPCRTALHVAASTGSPTGSPRSSRKPANSPHPENGQRLAGYADHSDGVRSPRQGRLRPSLKRRASVPLRCPGIRTSTTTDSLPNEGKSSVILSNSCSRRTFLRLCDELGSPTFP